MKKNKIGFITLICGLLIVIGLLLSVNYASNKTEAKTPNSTSKVENSASDKQSAISNNDPDKILKEMDDSNFLTKVSNELVNKNFISGPVFSTVDKKRAEVIIPVLSEKYNEKAKGEVQNIVKKIAKDCKISTEITINFEKADQ